MPELAAAYVVGFILTLCLMGLHIYLQVRKQHSASMRQVQSNLKKINSFWSETESQIKQYTLDEVSADSVKSDPVKADAEKAIRSILIAGIGFSFLSWLGLFFQFVLMISLRYLVVKRTEIRLFESELAEKDLDAQKSRELVAKIMQS